MNLAHEIDRTRLEAERIVKAVTDQCIERSRTLRRLARAEARLEEKNRIIEAISNDVFRLNAAEARVAALEALCSRTWRTEHEHECLTMEIVEQLRAAGRGEPIEEVKP